MLSGGPISPERDAARERVFGRAYQHAEGGGGGLAAALFAIALLLLIASLSAYEITRPTRAASILEIGIASLTDVDQVLAESLEPLREEAATTSQLTVTMPNYPLAVPLTREEVLTGDVTTIRGLLLKRSAAVVYAEGLGAFDRTGQQSVGVLSLAGVVEPIVGLLTDETHDRVRWAAIVTLIIATGMGATTLALNRGFARFRALGLAALLAAAPGFLVAWGSGFLLGRFGSDDAFERDLRLIFEGMLDVPQRNFLIVGILGLTVAVVGSLLGFAADRLEPQEEAPERLDDRAFDEPLESVPGPALPVDVFEEVPAPARVAGTAEEETAANP